MLHTDATLIGRLRARTVAVLRQAAPLCAKHKVVLPDPVLRYDLTGQTAGQAQWCQGQRPVLRYNLEIARRHRSDYLATTVPHEVAHLITFACHGRTRPHGPEWRAVMAYLGIPNASRCHNYAVDDRQIRRQRRWNYRCACQTHQLSTTRHKRAVTGASCYQCRQCGTLLRPFSGSGD